MAKQQLAVSQSALEARTKALAKSQAELERLRTDAERQVAEAVARADAAAAEAATAAAAGQRMLEEVLQEAASARAQVPRAGRALAHCDLQGRARDA